MTQNGPKSASTGTTTGHRRLIPLSGNEIRCLLAALALAPQACIDHVMHWSTWRRERQQQARDRHHLRAAANDPGLITPLLQCQVLVERLNVLERDPKAQPSGRSSSCAEQQHRLPPQRVESDIALACARRR